MLGADTPLRFTARAAELYFRLVARTIRLCLYVPNGRGLRPVDIEVLQAELARLNPVLIPFWNAHSLMLICAAYVASTRFHHASPSLFAVADDSLGGKLTERILSDFGLLVRQIRICSAEERLYDMRSLLEDRPSLVMAADSHGPYRAISVGMARLAYQYSGRVRPLSLACDRVMRIFRRIKMALPLPYATIVVTLGDPIGHDGSVIAVREALQLSLQELEQLSIAAL